MEKLLRSFKMACSNLRVWAGKGRWQNEITSIILLSLCVVTSSAAPYLSSEKSYVGVQKMSITNYTTNANPFVEQLLEMARPRIRESLEPVRLPDYSYKISQSVIVTEVTAEAKVHDGQLSGLSTLSRAGDAVVTSSYDGSTYSISAHLGVSNLVGFYRGEVKFMNLGPSMTIHLTVKTLTVKVVIFQGINGPAKTPPVLATFVIENLGEIVFDFDGLGPLDWIINPLSNFLLNKLKGVISWIVESPLHSLIAGLVPSIRLPNK